MKLNRIHRFQCLSLSQSLFFGFNESTRISIFAHNSFFVSIMWKFTLWLTFFSSFVKIDLIFFVLPAFNITRLLGYMKLFPILSTLFYVYSVSVQLLAYDMRTAVLKLMLMHIHIS